jgi:hypothetical protein
MTRPTKINLRFHEPEALADFLHVERTRLAPRAHFVGGVAAQRVSEGIKEGFTFGQYLMLVDCMSRTVREGKAFVSQEVESIFDRLQMDAQRWMERVMGMLTRNRFYGSFMSTSRAGVPASAGFPRRKDRLKE